jgi:hypothetical protein
MCGFEMNSAFFLIQALSWRQTLFFAYVRSSSAEPKSEVLVRLEIVVNYLIFRRSVTNELKEYIQVTVKSAIPKIPLLKIRILTVVLRLRLASSWVLRPKIPTPVKGHLAEIQYQPLS